MDEQTEELVMVPPAIQSHAEQPATATFPFRWVFTFLGILLVVGGSLFFIMRSHLHASFSAQATQIPQIKTVDFSPDVPLAQKTSLLIEKNDSSMEKVLIQKDLVQGYIQSLPHGYRVVSQKTAQ